MSFARISLNMSLPVQWVLRYPSPAIKRLGREADHLPPVVAKLRMTGIELHSAVCLHLVHSVDFTCPFTLPRIGSDFMVEGGGAVDDGLECLNHP
jgi:hypothetical protein